MPVYDYNCANGHWTEAFRRPDNRESCPPCDTCGEMTQRGWAIKPPPPELPDGPRYRNGELRAQWALVDLVCGCGHREVEALVPKDATTGACPSCGQAAAVTEHSGEKYIARDELLKLCNQPGGYEDRGAGRRFTSKKERREWMKAGGWEEAGGSLDQTIESNIRKIDDHVRREKAEWQQTLDRYNHHPDFAAYRRARDEGQLKHSNHRK